GQLTNAGTISGVALKAQSVDNSGTISGVTFNTPFVSKAVKNEDTGIISDSSFGETKIFNVGVVRADGADQAITFKGTELSGGTLGSSNEGVIRIVADPSQATVLKPVTITAGTTFVIDNGSLATLQGASGFNLILSDVSIFLKGSSQPTQLYLAG